MKTIYLILAITGILLPYTLFVPFLLENGLDLSLMAEQVFGTPSAAFFGVDVIISAIVLIFFILREGKKLEMENLWVYVLSTLLAGVSFSLPLFLFVREDKMKEPKKRRRKKHANSA